MVLARSSLDVTRLRPTVSLDGEWRFVADPERLHRPDQLPDGEPVTVPGPWEAQVARPYRIVTAWYHRALEVPPEWREGRVVVRFGAVMYRCSVFLNGVLLGSHEGGYTSFGVDLTPGIRWDAPNLLAVQVVNPMNGIDEFPAFSVERLAVAEEFEPDIPLGEAPHGKQSWYSSHSGLWMPVTLEHTPAVALGGLRITSRLPDEPGGDAEVRVRWSLETLPGSDGVERLVEVTLIDPEGEQVGRETAPLGPPAGGSLAFTISEPRLWDIGRGCLYRAEVRTLEDGRPADGLSERFGIREIRTEGGRLVLNRRPIYMLGALDQDFWPEGISTPPSRQALDRQCALALEMGINTLRCHIKVPDQRYLDAADEAGLLVWCELPSWSRFSSASAARGVETLRRMVETLGNHPSVIAWTIINEDWGTQLRWEPRDRAWLRNTYDWLKDLDPTRLVVDNSACETPATPNFHVKTDLLDFHIYYLVPDNAPRWRNAIDEISRRPAWLWSPHGDAEPRGDEPILLSEFGSWGLPRIEPLLSGRGREPWWFSTGLGYYRPTGIRRRFVAYGLDRIWSSVDELAEATQWHQFEAFQYQVGQLRRHGTIQGYVVTELADAFWEANGLLDVHRTPKAYHTRVREVNAPEVIVADVARRDLRGGGRVQADLTFSSYADSPAASGQVRWELLVGGTVERSGSVAIPKWPRADVAPLGRIETDVPSVDETSDARLRLRVLDERGRERARDEIRLAILAERHLRTERPLRVRVIDPGSVWHATDAVSRLGHDVLGTEPGAGEADLVVTTELSGDLVRRIDEGGGHALVLVRTRDALKGADDLSRRVSIVLRKLPWAGAPGQRSPWEGDWVSSFAWMLPGAFPALPARNPLDFAYEEVLPDHVLVGYDPIRHRDEVTAGMFVGWVHSPAALVWSFRQGRGRMTLTSLHVAPESGPMATALLEQLLQSAAGATRS